MRPISVGFQPTKSRVFALDAALSIEKNAPIELECSITRSGLIDCTGTPSFAPIASCSSPWATTACEAWFGASIHYASVNRPGPVALAGLFASALPNIFAVNVRFTKAGTNASMKRFSRPGTILDRFSRSA